MVDRLREVTLDDRFRLDPGVALLSGTQALVRLLTLQAARDSAAGLNTAGFVSGYRGSPLGGLDMQLVAARRWLDAAKVRFEPGVNEDLAATAIWGTQQVNLLPGARVDGVFALWYGKGPGVDRSGDPFKHGNRMGSSPHGGVLCAFGDDHAGKSSTVAHQSEPAMVAAGMPVLYPANVQEYLDFGLLGFALSRFAGVWVGFKCVNETVECAATVEIDSRRASPSLPTDVVLPEGGLNARFAFEPWRDDERLHRYKLPAAQAFARTNPLDRALGRDGRSRIGIVAPGKSWLDLLEGLAALGIDERRARELGIALYKPGLVWPLEPTRLTAFARGLDELIVFEEKSAFLEPQIARILFNLPHAERPRLLGKTDERGAPLIDSSASLEGADAALLLAARLAVAKIDAADVAVRAERLRSLRESDRSRSRSAVQRIPYFCSGCPHNTSTRVPEGSVAMSGIGCHTMALWMNRGTLPPTQMGGEGVNWTGIAPFTSLPHVFQNLGDGTYFHSGLLAVRAAVNAGANVTYKLLVNDAVAMTGGQAVEGHLSIVEITHQLRAERVGRIVVVSDEPEKWRVATGFAPGVTVHDRRELDVLQRELRATQGVTAIVYEQTCAAEKRRRRKRGTLPDPPRRVFINPAVCEGCGDCSVKSNCVSIEPLETPLGRKRRIEQSSCNKDFSCIEGFCPSFLVLEGARPRVRDVAAFDVASLPPIPSPALPDIEGSYDVLVTGIGGTGVVTIGSVLAMAAHLEGRRATVFDMTGLAQKGGAVLSHLRISSGETGECSSRIGLGEAELVLGCDLVVTAGEESMHAIGAGHTRVVVNAHAKAVARFQLDRDHTFRAEDLLELVRDRAGDLAQFDATVAAEVLLGDTVGANMMMVGFAWQAGLLPIGEAALERAIALNGAAVELNLRALRLGRLAQHDPAAFGALLAGAGVRAAADDASNSPPSATLEDVIATRVVELERYQNRALADRYRQFVERVRIAEATAVPGSSRLALAVAREYFRLLACKDEYEVARLHTDAALAHQLAAQFDGDYRVKVLLAPPLLARRDAVTGEPRKREFGRWVFPVLRALAKLKFLRGTPLDLFGYTRERRMERALVAEYEVHVAMMLARLEAGRLDSAVALASVPAEIRGFGAVKEAAVQRARQRTAALLAEFEAGPRAVETASADR